MKKLIVLLLVLISLNSLSWAQESTSEDQINDWVLEAISEMPKQGGFKLTVLSAKKLRDAFSWNGSELLLDPTKSTPSYCTTATYMIFYKVLEKYQRWSNTVLGQGVLATIKPKVEDDGVRIWGRWNSNGPGTAKFFADTELGKNFDNIDKALPGDFMKIFWNNHVGKLEKGHSVIYLGRKIVNGEEILITWGSHSETNGFSERLIPRKQTVRLLFSRLTHPQNAEKIAEIPERDEFLASMLVRESNWAEVMDVVVPKVIEIP